MNSKLRTGVWVAATVLISVMAIIFLKRNWAGVNTIIGSLGMFGPAISILLYALLALSPISTDPLSVVNVIVFGPIWGTLVVAGGNTAGAVVEYYFGRHIGNTTKAKVYLEKLPGRLNRIPIGSVWFLIVGRLVPGYGGKIVSILAGIKHVSKSRYLWTTLTTNLIGAMLITVSAHGLKSLF
jgi:uncharacterized membrane protein YdjX (TVP38/TMEM64 family)